MHVPLGNFVLALALISGGGARTNLLAQSQSVATVDVCRGYYMAISSRAFKSNFSFLFDSRQDTIWIVDETMTLPCKCLEVRRQSVVLLKSATSTAYRRTLHASFVCDEEGLWSYHFRSKKSGRVVIFKFKHVGTKLRLIRTREGSY